MQQHQTTDQHEHGEGRVSIAMDMHLSEEAIFVELGAGGAAVYLTPKEACALGARLHFIAHRMEGAERLLRLLIRSGHRPDTIAAALAHLHRERVDGVAGAEGSAPA